MSTESLVENLEGDADNRQLTAVDFMWLFLLAAGTLFALFNYQDYMNRYEQIILVCSSISIGWGGLRWPELRRLFIVTALFSLMAIYFYAGDLANAERFFLNYMLASQSAIMWMSFLFVLATCTYFLALFNRSTFTGTVASSLVWSATAMGLTGLLVRWYESYLIHPDVGHIPVSNLYEVFILFSVMTALIYLHYERRYATKALGGFVMLVITAAIGFLLWYTFDRGAHEIQPLVPALKSYWMKIHVPANFVGYGCFSIAAMLGVTRLLKQGNAENNGILAQLPANDVIEDIMYKSIALGFAFFTIATILGSLWAAEAWGGYWSWDPKETWALIVWLNYAAWLHMHISKGWHGPAMAWWSIVGFFVTLFAFLGVNMFLSGLHSYGEL